MKFALFTGLLVIVGVQGRVVQNTYHVQDGKEVVEHLRQVPEGWSDIGAPSVDHKLHFRIAVRSVSLHISRVWYAVTSISSRPEAALLEDPANGTRKTVTWSTRR